MGFDLVDLRTTVTARGRVVRVVIADFRGSSPREVGAAMLVWAGGQSGTIGGGALEYQAAQSARAQTMPTILSRHALGPDMGQCCGGAVTLLSEVYDVGTLPDPRAGVMARPLSDMAMPLSVKRVLDRARGQGVAPDTQLLDGWMIEPVHKPVRQIWIWGAGHVGRALVNVLSPLPDLAITWVDTAPDRFPEQVPDGVTVLPATDPAALVRHAPTDAEHLVLTYSHALDLELCNRLLGHDFSFAGLIGSATKWARFRSRLAALGHRPDQIARVTCPIGDPDLGKHPHSIAVGVAAGLLRPCQSRATRKDLRA